MKTECKTNFIKFQPLNNKEIIAAFDGGKITTDAGALLLREIEKRNSFIDDFSKCFTDYRNQEKIEHTITELLAQRIFGICLGYEDLNDHDELRHDPLLAAACDKIDPLGNNRELLRDKGKALAGKSTLNRLELSQEGDLGNERYKKIEANFNAIENYFINVFLKTYPDKNPKEIIIDLDATDDPIHGNQEGKFFHGYYDCYCYLPLYIFCGNYLLGAKLRRSNIDGCEGSIEELERIIPMIREKWPNVRIIIRGDSGFCREKIMNWCENNGVDYIFGLSKNDRLKKMIEKEMIEAKFEYKKTIQPAKIYKDFKYKTLDSWSKERRVIGKAEYLELGENPRFIVTTLKEDEIEAKKLYEEIYCARGDMENRIKEQQLYLFADRTSTAYMRSNQLRLWFSCVAYVILNELRIHGLKGTECEKYQCDNIRLKLLKIGAAVKISVRRIYISLSESYPYKAMFLRVMENIFASTA